VDTVIGGRYPVRKGQWAIVLIPALHRDPVWGDAPEAFDPDRFAPDRNRARPAHVYKPFGTGERACIGRQFALHEATLVLGMLLSRYDLRGDPSYELKVQELLTLKPEGFLLEVSRRSDTQFAESVTSSLRHPAQPGHPSDRRLGLSGTSQLHATLCRAGSEDGLHVPGAQAGQDAGQEGVVDPADQVRRLGREWVERAVPEPETRRRVPARFEAVPAEHPFGQRERPFRAQSAGAGPFTFLLAHRDAALPRDSHGGLARRLAILFGEHGVGEDAGEDFVPPGGDLHLDAADGRFVDLGPPPHPRHRAGGGEAEPEQPRFDEFVEVERGEFAGDPDRRGRLVTGDRTPGAPRVGVHAAAQVVFERRHRGDGRAVEAVRLGNCHVHHYIAYQRCRNIQISRSCL
jgi:hypothetical protein